MDDDEEYRPLTEEEMEAELDSLEFVEEEDDEEASDGEAQTGDSNAGQSEGEDDTPGDTRKP